MDGDLRLITLTAQIAKIMEGFTIISSLYSQVIDNTDFLQFALPGKSMTHDLIYILHCILEALDTAMLEFYLQTLAKGSTLWTIMSIALNCVILVYEMF